MGCACDRGYLFAASSTDSSDLTFPPKPFHHPFPNPRFLYPSSTWFSRKGKRSVSCLLYTFDITSTWIVIQYITSHAHRSPTLFPLGKIHGCAYPPMNMESFSVRTKTPTRHPSRKHATFSPSPDPTPISEVSEKMDYEQASVDSFDSASRAVAEKLTVSTDIEWKT